MEVKYWTSYEKAEKIADSYKKDISQEEWDEMEKTVISEIRKYDYSFGGYYHQGEGLGVPVLSNGIPLICSFRKWGEIMAEAHRDNNSDGMAYCKYAWMGECGLVPSETKPTNKEMIEGRQNRCHFVCGKTCGTCKHREDYEKDDFHSKSMCGNEKNHLPDDILNGGDSYTWDVNMDDTCDNWEK